MHDVVYAPLFEHQPESLGLMTGHAWAVDPKRLVFTAARYKFVAKMLEGRGDVLEIGCSDAFFTRIVQQHVGQVVALDFDHEFINDANKRKSDDWPVLFCNRDFVSEGPPPWPRGFDGVYSLDVLEHIQPEDDIQFLENARVALNSNGVAVFGMPSLESQHLASPISRAGHVNCKSGPDFKKMLQGFFNAVFMFSMNDEVVHTGHHAMAHYLLAVCAHPR